MGQPGPPESPEVGPFQASLPATATAASKPGAPRLVDTSPQPLPPCHVLISLCVFSMSSFGLRMGTPVINLRAHPALV